MHDDVRCKEGYGGHTGACFVKWGLWFFIIGVILGFGVLIHYLLGSAYDNSATFLNNITLWFGSPLAFSSGFLQIGGLAMAVIGSLCLACCKKNGTTIPSDTTPKEYRQNHRHSCISLTLCNVGLIALIITGYIGYYIINYIWPAFYYIPIMAGKNLWLILQGLSVLIYIIGIIIATNCLCKCRRDLPNRRP